MTTTGNTEMSSKLNKRGKRMKKPDIIFHYNEYKGVVDTFD